MGASIKDLSCCAGRGESCVRVTVIEAKGSTPREAGAAMLVFANDMAGTIGGGALEYDATAHAREMLHDDLNASWLRDTKDYPLGPRLGQCCGGHVRLLFERFGDAELKPVSAEIEAGVSYFARPIASGAPIASADIIREAASSPAFIWEAISAVSERSCFLLPHPDTKEVWFVERVAPKPLSIYLYGAGHVAREIVRVFEGMDVEIVWIDIDEARFPNNIPVHAKRLIAAVPTKAVEYAPEDAFHVVMTCSHPMDLDICHSILRRGVFRYLGLIGSQTKRERFLRRLRDLGISEGALDRLTCPIGAGGPAGKQPSVIAIALAAEILCLNDLSSTP